MKKHLLSIMILWNLVFVGYFLFPSFAKNSSNLVALFQIFRHGERTPMTFYPNDPFKTHWGDLEPEQLTNEGRRQLHTLGRLTRKRYFQWIPTKYNKDFLYAQTTDVDRTHISGQTYLYGLFPATGDQKWIPNSDWQAIPLHPGDPKVLWVESSYCPAYDDLYNKVLASEQFNKINKQYEGLYEYLTNHTGENITDLHSAEIICDTLHIEAGVGLVLPEWTKSVYPEPLLSLYGMWLKSLTYTTQLKRLYTGPLLNEMLDFFETRAANSTSTPKFKVYSAHDDNIAAILNSFDAFEHPYPVEFGSTLWIELRIGNDMHYVNVWFKNGEDLTQIRIKNCDMDCPLRRIRRILKDILVDVKNWTAECNTISPTGKT